MTSSISRIVLAAALALGSASAMAGTKYIFVQPSKGATCSGTECQTLQAAIQVAPSGTPANSGGAGNQDQGPSAEDVAQANQHIEQMWQNLYSLAELGYWPVLAQDYNGELNGNYRYYTVDVVRTDINPVLDQQGQLSEFDRATVATGTRSGISSAVCQAIAAKSVLGMTCSGGTLTGVLSYQVHYTFNGTDTATRQGTTGLGESWLAMQAATGTTLDVGMYPYNPI